MAVDPALAAIGKKLGMSDAEIAQMAGGGTGASQDNIWLKKKIGTAAGSNPRVAERGGKSGAGGGTAYQYSQVSADEGVLEFYKWDAKERQDWGKYLVANGILDERNKDDYQAQLKAWSTAVGEASGFAKAGRRMDPRDVIQLMGAAGGASGRPKSVTSTQKSYNLTDPTSARALVNNVLSSQLGREANADEIREFTKVLNAAENANPTISTQTTTTNADGSSNSSTSRTSGGLDGAGKQQLLVDKARSNPDYAAYQASTTYMDALMGALQAPV